MRIPRTITVLGRQIEISLIGVREMEKRFGENVVGIFQPHESKIYLLRNQTKEQRFQVLVHELGHLLCDVTGISQTLKDEVEEILCESFANGVVDFLKSIGQYKI